jgi:hypothetical protein
MIHLLLKSNYTVKQWQGNTVNPGELITSIGNLSKELRLSENEIRTCLKKLKKTNYVATESTSKFTKIRIIKSIIYDEIIFTNNEQIYKPLTNKPHSNNEQITTTNKVKKEKNLEERKEFFKNEVFKHKNTYSESFLISFFRYWSEENEQTGRLKFEIEKFWNFENRLSLWKQPGDDIKKKSLIKNRQ